MVFSVKLVMMKMYQVQNAYIADINLGGGGSLQHTKSSRKICGYISLSSITPNLSQ